MTSDPKTLETQDQLLELLDKIEHLLNEVRDRVIDGDPEMNETLRKAQKGE